MKKKEHNKSRSFTNDLDQNSDYDKDPDYDYDENTSKQSEQIPIEEDTKDSDRYLFKNAVLIFIVFAAAFLWFNNWRFSESWTFIFGNDEQTTEVAAGTPGFNQLEGEVPNPSQVPSSTETEALTSPATNLDMTITEYMSALQNKGYLGDEISGHSARQLYDSNVPISYLDELQEAGFLEDLSFVYITHYYQNAIPLTYLEQLQQAGVYDELSFVDITEFYNKNIPTDYLVTLENAGYLEELSFVYITSFYEAGVTVQFLDKLKEQNLYEDLNFVDIVDLYKRENGD